MATDYPIEIDDVGGGVRIGGIANFTDPDNQPAPPGSPSPFKPAADQQVTIVEDSAGDPAYVYDDDGGDHDFTGTVRPDNIDMNGGDVTGAGTVDGQSLGSSFVYVTVQAAAPTTYLTPIVVDTTAVSGATYAWDGSAYQEIANLIT